MPRAAVREETVKLEADVAAPTEAHLDDEARLRQLGYKQELVRSCAWVYHCAWQGC